MCFGRWRQYQTRRSKKPSLVGMPPRAYPTVTQPRTLRLRHLAYSYSCPRWRAAQPTFPVGHPTLEAPTPWPIMTGHRSRTCPTFPGLPQGSPRNDRPAFARRSDSRRFRYGNTKHNMPPRCHNSLPASPPWTIPKSWRSDHQPHNSTQNLNQGELLLRGSKHRTSSDEYHQCMKRPSSSNDQVPRREDTRLQLQDIHLYGYPLIAIWYPFGAG